MMYDVKLTRQLLKQFRVNYLLIKERIADRDITVYFKLHSFFRNIFRIIDLTKSIKSSKITNIRFKIVM